MVELARGRLLRVADWAKSHRKAHRQVEVEDVVVLKLKARLSVKGTLKRKRRPNRRGTCSRIYCASFLKFPLCPESTAEKTFGVSVRPPTDHYQTRSPRPFSSAHSRSIPNRNSFLGSHFSRPPLVAHFPAVVGYQLPAPIQLIDDLRHSRSW